MTQRLPDDLRELDTTMSFVVKIRHKAWIKAKTEECRETDSKSSDSKTLRDILDAAIATQDKETAA